MTGKITFICGNIYPLLHDTPESTSMGGAEVQQFLLAQELQKLGVEVGFVTRTPTGADEISPQGFCIYGYRLAANPLARVWSFARAVWRAGASGPRPVDYFRGISVYVLLCRLIATVRRRPFLLAISSNRSVYPPEVAGYSGVQSRLYRVALRTSTRVIAQTRFQADMLTRHYGVDPARLVVIPNGAQESTIPVEAGATAPTAPPTVVWLATVHKYKGVEAVLELARHLPDYRFIIGGGPAHGEQEYFTRVSAEAASLPNVVWRGFVARHEVDQLMQGALAFLNTTVARPDLPNLEGFPNVYLEAWRNGVPTLTLHNDPDGVIVAHRLGFASGSVAQMTQALLRLVEEPALYEEMRGNVRRYFAIHHHIAECARQYAQLLDALHVTG